MTIQKYSSKDTSISTVNKIYKNVTFPCGSVVLDYGGGKYDLNKNYLLSYGVELLVYDPYNRTAEHNQSVWDSLKKTNLKYVVCSNVLNVIYEEDVIINIVEHIYNLLEYEGKSYFQIYEGNKSGIGKETTKGYQRNQSTKEYLSMINNIFGYAELKNGIITAVKKGELNND